MAVVVEWFPLSVGAGVGVVVAHDEVGAAVVACDDGVQQGLAGAGHANGQGQKAQQRAVGRIVAQRLLVAAHAGVVVQVIGQAQAHDGQQEQVGAGPGHGPEGHFELDAVQGMAGLKAHDPFPTQLVVEGPDFVGREALLPEIVVQGQAQHFQGAADVVVALFVEQVVGPGMEGIGGAQHGLGFALLVDGPDVGHVHDGQQETFGVANGDGLARFEGALLLFRNAEAHGDGPWRAVLKLHAVQHRFVIRPGHEAGKRRECAGGQQLDVAELMVVEGDACQMQGEVLENGRPVFIHEKLNQITHY